MSGGSRFLGGIAAVVLVVSALGIAAPSQADLNGQAPVRSEVAVNR